MKKTILMMAFWLILLSPMAMAYTMDVSITVERPLYQVGLFSVTFFGIMIGIGFIVTVAKVYFGFESSSDFMNRTFLIVIVGILVTSIIGILLAMI